MNLNPARKIQKVKIENFQSWKEVEIDFEHTDWKWVPAAELHSYDLAPSVLEIFEKAKSNGY